MFSWISRKMFSGQLLRPAQFHQVTLVLQAEIWSVRWSSSFSLLVRGTR
jgi:hypothetical protein